MNHFFYNSVPSFILLLGILFLLIIGLIFVFLIIYLVRRDSKTASQKSKDKTIDKKETEDNPLEILKIRYAKGELNSEEYKRIKEDLEE